MKKVWISLSIIACILISFGFISAAKAPNEVILVRGYLYIGSIAVNTIKIYRGNAPVEIIKLEKTKTTEAFDSDVSKIVDTVNTLTAQGYEVVSSTEAGANGVIIFDFTLSK